ncbi:unnamed protein product [Owenia fusiformis]|uniref:DNA mismatch repair protein n=1 Tax=Owenia fusiformis TaxID=6347 RepID=A0A8J1U8F5_OWEFU|nr:unnamed protein product [Owenia fusiformis]
MPKVNTLFSYFKKVPTPSKTENISGDNKSNVLNAKNSNDDLIKENNPVPAGKTPKDDGSETSEFKECDIVWGKLDGYPWWPALVCKSPSGKYYKLGKKPEVHLQFFDDPISRAWLKTRFVDKFLGSDDHSFQRGGKYHTYDAKCQKFAAEADKAMSMSHEDRMMLVMELESSSEEDEPVHCEKMDFNADIFDDEVGEEEEGNNSKENHQLDSSSTSDKVKSPKSTPKKTPKKKNGRPMRSTAKKRKVVIESGDEESGDEYNPDKTAPESSDDESSGVDENISDIESLDEAESPVKESRKRKRGKDNVAKNSSDAPPTASKSQAALASFSAESSTPSTPKTPATPSIAKTPSTPSVMKTPTVCHEATKSRLSAFSAPDSVSSPSRPGVEEQVYTHFTLDFLKPDKIKDAEKRLKSHPDYDPRTLHIPERFLNDCTPGHRQWWDIKAKLFDTVLFFKVGKFYELYHMDAVTGVNELGLIYMKGAYAHSGFPEIAYGRYSETLVQKGYKVARVEQTENPDMMNERCKNSTRKITKFDKVVKREVCAVTTPGTKTYSFLDGDASNADNAYLMAICEKTQSGLAGETSVFGVCFVDTTVGRFHVGQFEDDRHCSRLRTILAHHTPTELLIERGEVSSKVQQVFNSCLTGVPRETLNSNSQFWDSTKTLKYLSEGEFFKDDKTREFSWPETLKNMISEADSLGQTASAEYDLAIRSLGAITWYLQHCLMDHAVLSMKNFTQYIPVDSGPNAVSKPVEKKKFTNKQKMVLDGITLSNLDVMDTRGNQEGTLLQRLDHCVTPFGKRLFQQWLCAPLCNPEGINDRLDAVEDLWGVSDVTADVTDSLKKLPDLERLLSKIHTLGSLKRSKDHPDARAIMYEDVTYSKRKIEDFVSALTGFKVACDIMEKFKSHNTSFKSKLLQQTVSFASDDSVPLGRFPDLRKDLAATDRAFDHTKAKQSGVIKPLPGCNPDYDQAIEHINSIEEELDDYLKQQRKRLKCNTLVYWGKGKNRCQIEVPDSLRDRVPDDFELQSQKKGCRRYRTTEIEDLLKQLERTELDKERALTDTMRLLFWHFDKKYKDWEAAVQCLATLDVLLNISRYSQSADGAMCRPELILPDDATTSFLEIRDARHPCVSRTFSGGDYIPNDTVIGIRDENAMKTEGEDQSHSSVVIVTGPNMGGKSTLMRQVGLVVIMAQLGCYVPAEKCKLTPVDRVFTRLGASDRIMSGESTFFVELSETSAILQHVTPHSLVLMDELGRGTATYDGTAIACAVVQELSQNVKCRTLFSTHYHSLVEEFSHDPNVRTGHMACMVENEDENDPSQETITFLYKFIGGACPKSYGFNAARLADLPNEIILRGQKKAIEFEESIEKLKLFRSIVNLTKDSLGTLQKLQTSIPIITQT